MAAPQHDHENRGGGKHGNEVSAHTGAISPQGHQKCGQSEYQEYVGDVGTDDIADCKSRRS